MVNIVYTNHRCKDVFRVFKTQHDKHCTLPLHVISDYEGDTVYDENTPYYTHWLTALNSIESEYFIYNQEDFILYDDVNVERLNEYKNVLEANPKYSFIRLLKSGKNLGEQRIHRDLYETTLTSYPLYSMQATLWRKDRFVELYSLTKQDKWFECEAYETACEELNIEGLYHYSGESSRGGHFDSNVYPYTATAVVRGMWNFREYEKELQPLLEAHQIDYNIRGIF